VRQELARASASAALLDLDRDLRLVTHLFDGDCQLDNMGVVVGLKPQSISINAIGGDYRRGGSDMR
jgi:hypothetical protein